MAQHLNYLEVALTQENTPVTYRTLSRKANINVTAAKKLLYQFVSTTKHNVSATYCVSGEGLTSIPGNEPTQTIRLVDAEDLEEARKQFKYITGVHIYSVQPSKLKDHSVLVTASSDLPTYSLADLPRLGVIRDNSITTSESRPAAPPPSSYPKAAAANKPASVPTQAAKPTASKVQTKAQTNQEKANQNKSEQRNVASLFSAAAAKKVKSVAKPKPIAQPAPVTESAPAKSKNVKKIQSDSEEEEDDEEMDRRLAASSRQAESVEDFWKDDEVDPVSPSKTISAKEADGEATPINQPNETDQDIAEVTVTKPADDDVQAPRERRRLKRKVLKKKHYKDESGYLVTDDVYEWESYSEDETTEPVLKRKAPPASPSKNDSKKSAKKGSAADQKSLLSFWGKR
ncbi:hypothetical protein K450DRAFT_236702 [Umbelopsis ramanniana AG]|uniref:DNA polymerase delta subunit 3 n=1 Tax=Umbelopsis ramanniana AG TaxID=1314678 RepID=A0AAD5ECX9_UMBRA|nr:uncharacterized protein K450DRAFT_236702 [Umbelopsis ramanniana AG]KAI8580670.1 hypothetical protein K450DRAFT_236702 [Umbelopsis ramanniana AG]